MLMLRSITDLLEARKARGHFTTLRKIRANINIQGNDLVDAAAKLAITNFETLPPDRTL